MCSGLVRITLEPAISTFFSGKKIQVKRLTGVSWLCAATGVAFLLLPGYASAQELEPGAYWPIPAGLNIVTVANSFNWGDRRVRSRGAHRRGERQDQHDGAVVHAGVQRGGAIRQRGRSAAGCRWPRRGPVSRSTRGCRPVRTGRSETPRGDESVWGAGDDAEGVRLVRARDHRRRQPHRGAAARTIRSGEADQPRHQSLVVQAGDRLLAGPRQVGRGGDGRACGCSRTTRTSLADARASRIRLSRRSSTSPTSSSAPCGWRRTPTTSPADGRR